MSAIEIEPSLDIRAENNPLKGPTEAKQFITSPQQLAMVMMIAQYPVLLASARLGSSLPEAVAEEMPSLPSRRRVVFNGLSVRPLLAEKSKDWSKRRGSGRSRREICLRCKKKHSAGFTFNNDCEVSKVSKSQLLRLPVFWWRTKLKPI